MVMFKEYIFLNEDIYKKILIKNNNKKIILELIKKLKLPLDFIEVENINKLLNNKTKKECINFFDIMFKIENKKYKNYGYVDYFFLSKLPNKHKLAIDYLNDINLNFNQYCLEIEKNNLEKIKLAKKIQNEKEFKIILEGGLSLVENNFCFREKHRFCIFW